MYKIVQAFALRILIFRVQSLSEFCSQNEKTLDHFSKKKIIVYIIFRSQQSYFRSQRRPRRRFIFFKKKKENS